MAAIACTLTELCGERLMVGVRTFSSLRSTGRSICGRRSKRCGRVLTDEGGGGKSLRGQAKSGADVFASAPRCLVRPPVGLEAQLADGANDAWVARARDV